MASRCPLCGAEVLKWRGKVPYHLRPRQRGERGYRGCDGPDAAQVPHYPDTTTTFKED